MTFISFLPPVFKKNEMISGVLSFNPTPSLVPKYSTNKNIIAEKLLPKNIQQKQKNLLSAAFSASTWNKHNAAINCLKLFEKNLANVDSWPLDIEKVREFTSWCILSKKLNPQTVKDYLSSINTIHKLHGKKSEINGDFRIEMMIRGAENLRFYENITEKTRLVVTLPILKIIGHEIAKSDWEKQNKQVFWTACVIAFFGSFRMGEILSKNEKSYNPNETLLWEDIVFREDSVLIHVKIPKTRSQKGEYIDLFPFTGHNCCPVTTLKRLKSSLADRAADKDPVFKFPSGLLLTTDSFSSTIKKILTPQIGEKANWFAAHSFRAGIPSSLSADPETAKEEDIKKWGRWSSASYQSYTRLKFDQKRAIFRKITSVLSQGNQ